MIDRDLNFYKSESWQLTENYILKQRDTLDLTGSAHHCKNMDLLGRNKVIKNDWQCNSSHNNILSRQDLLLQQLWQPERQMFGDLVIREQSCYSGDK